MPTKISQLPAAISSAAADVAAMVQSGTTRKVTLQQLAEWTLQTFAGFLQSGTGAAARTFLSKNQDVISVKDFGAACDDTTDDTAAIQAAIDSVGDTSVTGRAGPDILIPGPCRITSTLTIRRKGLRLTGNGWGHRDDTGTRRSYLRWDGAAGSSMVKFSDCYTGPAGISRLKLMGKVGANPSCAIELNETNDSVPNQQLHLEDVYIGGFSGETGQGVQFTRGIEWTGSALNNSEQLFENVYVTGCSGAGIYQNSIQHLNLRLDHVTLYFNGVGAHVTGHLEGSNVTFLGNTIDIEQPFQDGAGSQTNINVNIHGYYSELAGRMFETNGVYRFTITGGLFQIGASLNADGKIVKHETNTAGSFRLQDFRFTQGAAPSGSPHLAIRTPGAGATQHQIILDNITGWNLLTGGTYGLDIATRGPSDRTYIYLRENLQSADSELAKISQCFVNDTGSNWDPNRFEVKNDTALKWMDDFLGDVLADQWNGRVGTDPQCVAPAITGGAFGGAVKLVTGDDAAADMATNGVQLDSALNWDAVRAGLTFECRIKLSAITNVAVFIGFTDQIAVLEMPINASGVGDGFTATASNACGVMFDTAMSTDNWWGIGVAANVVAASPLNVGSAPVAATYETFRIEVETGGGGNGTIVIWRNGVRIGSVAAALVVTTPLTPIIAGFSRGAASRNIEADYILTQCNRF